MEAQIIDYITKEKGQSGYIAESLKNKVCKYEDIKSEFLKWLEARNYDYPDPLIIAGYSAADIHKMAPSLDGIGVYNFMVDLRDRPDEAKEIISEGFLVR